MPKTRADVLQGTLDMLVLQTLGPGPMHGYGIARRIQQVTEDLLRIEEGSLYPALYRMEGQGWIRAEWGTSENNRRAKYYRLTRTGRRRLAAEVSNWERLSRAVGRVLAPAGEGVG
ncbi:MAG TPA: PadR family transcriptional regulator [Blastocatellia bacterium]|nr:PadR family transcriptional regulator [Blastocatellia bacterium]